MRSRWLASDVSPCQSSALEGNHMALVLGIVIGAAAGALVLGLWLEWWS